MRWLLVKDLRILRRSPLLVALLVLYPIVIAVLIGFAISRGPDKPTVAIYNGLPDSAGLVELGGERIDLAKEGRRIFEAVEPLRTDSRAEAIQKVRDGEALAALIIPEDLSQNLQSTLSPGTVEVFYNAEDPAKKEFVENTINSQVQAANAALTKRVAEEALELLKLISDGGVYTFLGQDVSVLGLQQAEQILRDAQEALPQDGSEREELEEAIEFAGLARENLAFSDDVLDVVGEPIRVDATALEGGDTSLSSFAVALAVTVSLMFITMLLAAGMLALEREENAFARLVRGLVSRTGLLVEKAALAAVCSAATCLLMLAGLGLFVELDWARVPLWLVALGAGALAFAALGPGHRGAHAGGPGRVTPGLHALPAAGLPRAGAVRRGGARALRPDPGGVRGLPLQAHAGGYGRGAERRRRPGRPAASPRPAGVGLRNHRPAGVAPLRLRPAAS